MSESVDFSRIYELSDRQISHRYKYIGEGIARRVYELNDDYVIKLAKGREGFYQSKVEYYVFTHVNTNTLKYLCPIVWFTPRMVIMRRAIPLTKITKSRHVDLYTIRPEEHAARDLKTLALDFFLYYKDIINITSWGKLDDNNVLIDYGCTSRVGDVYYDMLFGHEDYRR